MQSISIESFQLEPLLACAQEKAGIVESSDTEIVEPLLNLLAAYRTEAGFSEMGLQMAYGYLVECLVMRMRIRDTIRRHPEILEEEVIDPVIIVGLSRTGTTKLQRTLGATGVFQTLPLWKILNPLPLVSDSPGVDSRIAVAEQFVAGIKKASPRFYAGHPMVATEPDEEASLQDMSFICEGFSFRASIPSYQSRVLKNNTEPSYRWLKMVLQLLQWEDKRAPGGRRWLLKSPIHIGRLDEIFSVFPDAAIVHSHRDLASAVPSSAALTDAIRVLYADKSNKPEAGKYITDLFSNMMNSNVEARKRWETAGKKFIDVQFSNIVSNIDGVTENVFGQLGLPFTAEAKATLARWETANPQHKHGNFDYDLESYGLTVAEIEKRFGAYIARHSST